MSVQQVRILLGDLPKWDRQTSTGDGITKNFIASTLPIITDSETVTVNSAPQTKITHYTLNADLGLFQFVTAPTSGHAIVTQFSYAELSDESITALLALNDNVYLAAAMGAESLAGKYASKVDRKLGPLSISESQRSKHWSDLAVKLRASASRAIPAASSVWVGGVSKAERDTLRADTDYIRPFFERDMDEESLINEQRAE